MGQTLPEAGFAHAKVAPGLEPEEDVTRQMAFGPDRENCLHLHGSTAICWLYIRGKCHYRRGLSGQW